MPASKKYLRDKILSVLRSKLDKVTGGTWKIYYAPVPENVAGKALLEFMCTQDHEDILAVVDTTLSGACDEGLCFTTDELYYKDSYDTPEFIKYDEINNMRVISGWLSDDLEIYTYGGSVADFTITSTYYNKTEFKSLLYKICAVIRESKTDSASTSSSRSEDRSGFDLNANKKIFNGADFVGDIYGNVSAASATYAYDKFATLQGHGFAAEQANHIYDKIRGHDAQMLGFDNAPNGADRSVDGILIQSKYCATGSKCIEECFNKSGEFRYYSSGKPMQIEVPSDKYDEAVRAMQEKIRQGKINGVNDPSQAKNIVRQGHYTYQQAKNIAKAGNIDSIKFDAQTGMIIGLYSGGISAAISFAVSLWNGGNLKDAVINAGMSFLKVGGTTALTVLCASQIAKLGSKAAVNSFAQGTANAFVNILGPKASHLLLQALGKGTNVYGAAAMKSASKLLKGNIITAAISTAILSTGDIINIFSGRISGAQLFKNLTTTVAEVGGATAGWVGGAAAGAAIGSIIPGAGTAIGGFLGGLIGAFGGGSAAGSVAKGVLDEFIEDDADQMVKILQDKFESLADEFLINKSEAEKIADELKNSINGTTLKDMFASSSRYSFADDLMRPIFEFTVSKRKKITLPDDSKLLAGVRTILENIDSDAA